MDPSATPSSANTSTSSRSANLTIAGKTFSVSQAGITCSYSVAPTTAPAPATAGQRLRDRDDGSRLRVDGVELGLVDVDHGGRQRDRNGTRLVLVRGQPDDAVALGRADGRRTAGHHHAGGRLRLQHLAGERVGDRGVRLRKRERSRQGRLRVERVEPSVVDHVQYADVRHRQRQRRLRRSRPIPTAARGLRRSPSPASPSSSPRPVPRATPRSIRPRRASSRRAPASTRASTLPGGCTWTAVPSVSWITVLSGASGSGNGTVNYRVDANPAGDVAQRDDRDRRTAAERDAGWSAVHGQPVLDRRSVRGHRRNAGHLRDHPDRMRVDVDQQRSLDHRDLGCGPQHARATPR